MRTYTIRRATEVPAPNKQAAFGAAKKRLAFELGRPLAGFSLEGRTGEETHSDCYVRAFFLQDEHGERAAFCVVDMWAASRYVLERAATVSATCGITVDRLIVAGTHTHYAPGQYMGNSLYDRFAQKTRGFDRRYADWLGETIGETVNAAAARAEAAEVGFATSMLWGLGWNRSYGAFQANPEAATWPAQLGIGGAVGPLSRAQLATDPRLKVFCARRPSDKKLLGAWGTFACHPITRGNDLDAYSADWPGVAVDVAEVALRDEAGVGLVVGLAQGACGDVNPVVMDADLEHQLGTRVGEALAETAREAAGVATTCTLDIRFAEPTSRPPPDGSGGPEQLADWWYGLPTILGAEQGRTKCWPRYRTEPHTSATDFPPNHPQHPKRRAVGALQWIVHHLPGLEPSPIMPLHVLRLGQVAVATLPGEPTTLAAWRVEQALCAHPELNAACVVGYAGDYFGYLTTEEEFRKQHYEGSSNILGRNTLRYLKGHVVALAEEMTSPPKPRRPLVSRRVRFRTLGGTQLVEQPIPGEWAAVEESSALAAEAFGAEEVAIPDRASVRALLERAGVLAPAPELGLESVSFGDAEGVPDAHLIPTLDTIEELRQAFRDDPVGMMEDYRLDYGEHATRDELLARLDHAERAIRSAGARLAELESVSFAGGSSLPPEYQFPGYEPEIPIDKGQHTFEDVRDFPMWGLTWAHSKLWRWRHDKPDFPHHDDEKSYCYPLADLPCEVALFSDWGTGYYHSAYIARHIARRRPAAAIHLGDVYYIGSEREFRTRFANYLDQVLRVAPTWVLNANHEMMSHGIPYFDYLKQKRAQGQKVGYAPQPQQGSYFCLWNAHYQLIGLDTAFFGDGRLVDEWQREWLRERLEEGRAAGRVNILLTQNEACSLGERAPQKLYSDVRDVAEKALEMVDLWFWGDEHLCALYDRKGARQFPFYGSCIGDGGFPYTRKTRRDEDEHNKMADECSMPALRWLDKTGRFPSDLGWRPKRGNNGFCWLRLKPDAIDVDYLDWRLNSRLRCTFSVAGGRLTLLA